MNILVKLCFLGIFWFGLSNQAFAQKMDVCNIYGSVYVTKNSKEADFVIYEEETEAFADLKVFREDNRLFADRKGLWYFTETMSFAHFIVFITDNIDLADFTVHYIETPAFAGCE